MTNTEIAWAIFDTLWQSALVLFGFFALFYVTSGGFSDSPDADGYF